MNKPTTLIKTKSLFWIAAATAILAVFDHAYLLREHYELRFGEVSGDSLCNINDLFNCAAVSASKYSELFGIPVALFGIAANAVLALLMFSFQFTDDDAKPTARRILLALSGAIALTSVVMAAISTFLVSRLCPFCIVAYLLSFIGFATLFISLRQSRGAHALPPRQISVSDFKLAGILGAIAFIGVFVANDKILRSYNQIMSGDALQREAQAAVLDWSTQRQVTIDTTNALEAGATPENAKMVITEFADYRCPHCKHAAPKLKAFMSSHADVRLQFLAWPLDGECNTVFGRANGASCLLARLTYCSLKNGGQAQGWASHEFVFENQEKFVTKEAVEQFIPELAGKIGADAATLAACADSAEAKTAIEKQTAVGTALNLRGTPTIYVNGKYLSAGQSLMVLEATHRAITEGR